MAKPRNNQGNQATQAQSTQLDPTLLASSMQNGVATASTEQPPVPGGSSAASQPPVDTQSPLPQPEEVVTTPSGTKIEPLSPPLLVIELPMGTVEPGFATPRIDMNSLTRRQAAAAKMLWCSAAEQGLRCTGGIGSHPDGSAVQTITGGIRLMLDRYADAFEEESGMSLERDFSLSFR